MKDIKINQILTDEEVNKYCLNNNYTLIMVSYKENETILKVI